MSAVQNLEVKSGSWSRTMSRGRLFSQYHALKKIVASSSAEMVVFEGISHMLLPRQSVNVMMQLSSPSLGRGPMKSIPTESPQFSGIGRGCSGPARGLVGDLLWMQSVQARM